MLARVLSFVAWGLVAASSVYWGTQLFAKPLQISARPALDAGGVAPDLGRLLGEAPQASTAPVPAAASRFQLLGVVASQSKNGPEVALIAVDGLPHALRVGAVLEGEWKLVGVERRAVSIARDGQPALRLELPMPTEVASVAPAAPLGTRPPAAPSVNAEMVATPPLPQGMVPHAATTAAQ